MRFFGQTSTSGAAICALMEYAAYHTTRRRRLSSITRAPCRRVMGVPGPAFAGGAEGGLIVLDASNVLQHAFRSPRIDADEK